MARRFALVAAGGELATAFGVTGWSAGEAIKSAIACYQAWLESRGRHGSQEDDPNYPNHAVFVVRTAENDHDLELHVPWQYRQYLGHEI